MVYSLFSFASQPARMPSLLPLMLTKANVQRDVLAMRTHTSCCGAAAAARPRTAGPGFLPLPFAHGPLGRPAGGGRFSATLMPMLKRLRCPGGRSGSAISGRFEWFYGPELEFSVSK
jgi:hypothetical protein